MLCYEHHPLIKEYILHHLDGLRAGRERPEVGKRQELRAKWISENRQVLERSVARAKDEKYEEYIYRYMGDL